MFNFFGKVILSVSFLVLNSTANASLITNGSFEQLTFADNSESIGTICNTNLKTYNNKHRAWDVFYSLPGWMTTYGYGIELQKNVVTRSQDGLHHVELDSHSGGRSNAVMTQTLDELTIGADYLLEFYYKPRTNRVNDNGINVFWYDAEIDFAMDLQTSLVADSTRSKTPNWILQSVLLTAQSESMDLSFGAFGKQNTVGGLIDNVSLVQVTDVPEPSSLALACLGFGLLTIRRRKQA